MPSTDHNLDQALDQMADMTLEQAHAFAEGDGRKGIAKYLAERGEGKPTVGGQGDPSVNVPPPAPKKKGKLPTQFISRRGRSLRSIVLEAPVFSKTADNRRFTDSHGIRLVREKYGHTAAAFEVDGEKTPAPGRFYIWDVERCEACKRAQDRRDPQDVAKALMESKWYGENSPEAFLVSIETHNEEMEFERELAEDVAAKRKAARAERAAKAGKAGAAA